MGKLSQHGRDKFGVFIGQDGAAFDQAHPRPEPQEGLRQSQALKARADDDEVFGRPVERQHVLECQRAVSVPARAMRRAPASRRSRE